MVKATYVSVGLFEDTLGGDVAPLGLQREMFCLKGSTGPLQGTLNTSF